MRRLLLLALLLVPARLLADAPADADRINKKIDGIDHPALKDKKAAVVVFLSFDCPVSNSYAPALAALHKSFAGRGVGFLGVVPGDLTVAELKKHADDFAVGFPLVLDPGLKKADALKAKVAPEAFVLDHNGVLRYRGRIDNAYHARLRRNPRTTDHDLNAAVEDLLAGKPVKVPVTKAVGCPLVRPDAAKAAGAVTYHKDVLPVLQTHCQQCHRAGEVGPFALMTYKQAANWASDIKEYTQSGKMPPWKVVEGEAFHNDRRMTEAEKKTLAAWADGGAPEGDPEDGPKPRTFTDGWQLGTPDLVLTVPEDFTLGASGPDAFRCFVLPTGLTEDKFVTAVEVRPGNKKVVHHSLNFFDASGKARELEKAEKGRKKEPGEQDAGPGYKVQMGVGFTPDPAKFGGIGGWAPGQRARHLPDGYGYPLPKGSDFVLQLHYHRDGRVEKDRTTVGLYFAKQKGVKPYKGVVLRGNFLFIPAGASDFKIDGCVEVQEDCELRSVMPHMHMLGRGIKVTMVSPDGRRRTLLNVDDWDYNWQETYFLKEPIKVAKGTRLGVQAAYDNSPRNPSNPFNPPRWVRFGEQTDQEMCFVFFGVTNDATRKRVASKPVAFPKE
ncbi:MAG: redoxin domain-containing protein [Gemmataceae bacterium]